MTTRVYRKLTTTNLLKRFHSRPLMPTIYGTYWTILTLKNRLALTTFHPNFLSSLLSSDSGWSYRRLINHFITDNTWPTEWKYSNITPAHKKSDETNKTNFRPVSVLTELSKLCEKIMYDRIYSTFCPNLSQNLSGFIAMHTVLKK